MKKELNCNEYKKTYTILKRMIDGEPVNIDPLKTIPKPKMTLYGFSNIFLSKYFDTREELEEWIKNNGASLGTKCIIEYIGNVADRSDVVRKVFESGKSILYSVCDEDGYGIYNNERSIYCGRFVWEYNNGDISDIYSAFRDRGISFENDIYGEIEKRNQQLLKYCKENNLFHFGKK